MRRADEIMGTARLIVHKRTPYFRAALRSLVPKEVSELGTLGVTDRAVLYYDPEWLSQFDSEVIAGLLAHEIMHLVQGAGARRGPREPARWNYACDLAINPSVVEMGYQLPQGENGGLFPNALGFAEGLTADEYYRLLEQQEQSQPKPKGGKGAGEGSGSPGDASSESGGGKGAPGPKGPARGQCGSCAGHPGEGEGTPEQQDADGGRTPSQLERMQRQVAEAIRDHVKSRGRLPAGLARWADEALEPPKVPWRQALASLVRSASAYRPGAVTHRYDGPSRRQAGIGYGPGKPILPRLRQPVPRVAVVADTSGSMSAADLGIALRESRGVLKAIGAEVTFCTCDAAVHGITQVASVEQMASRLVGGGGTDFTPAFEALAKRRPSPELIITMTDGDGAMPKREPPGIRVIWVLVGKYRTRPAWGDIIEVDD